MIASLSRDGGGGGEEGEDSYIERTGMVVVSLRRAKKRFGYFSDCSASEGRQHKPDRRRAVVFELLPLKGKNFIPGVLFRISDLHLRHFCIGASPRNLSKK